MTAADYLFAGDRNQPPQLQPVLNLATIEHAVSAESAPRFALGGLRGFAQARADGFAALHSLMLFAGCCREAMAADMPCYQSAIVSVDQLAKAVPRWQQQGFAAATVIVGQGGCSRERCIAEAKQLVAIAEQTHFPLFLELHRNSISEDIEHCLAIVAACPAIRFNADFSHYITAYRLDQLSSAQMSTFLQQIQPILQRVRFFHLRFASSDAIQLNQAGTRAMQAYAALCFGVFSHFKQQAVAGQVMPVAPELLSPLTGYCDLQRGQQGHRECDSRYQAARQLIHWVEQLFQQRDFSLTEVAAETPAWLSQHLDSEAALDSWQQQISADSGVQLISMGSKLWPAHNAALLAVATQLQQQRPQCLIAVARNTALHSLADCLAAQQRFPEIRLALSLPELLLSVEPKPLQLLKIYRQLKQLQPNIALLRGDYATAEYRFEPQKYPLKSYLRADLAVISQLLEKIYQGFTHLLLRQFNAATQHTRNY